MALAPDKNAGVNDVYVFFFLEIYKFPIVVVYLLCDLNLYCDL